MILLDIQLLTKSIDLQGSMGRTKISFDNRDKFIDLGIAISNLRKAKGMSQEELADKASISRTHLSFIEAPGMVQGISLNTLFNISEALDVDPAEILHASVKKPEE